MQSSGHREDCHPQSAFHAWTEVPPLRGEGPGLLTKFTSAVFIKYLFVQGMVWNTEDISVNTTDKIPDLGGAYIPVARQRK